MLDPTSEEPKTIFKLSMKEKNLYKYQQIIQLFLIFFFMFMFFGLFGLVQVYVCKDINPKYTITECLTKRKQWEKTTGTIKKKLKQK